MLSVNVIDVWADKINAVLQGRFGEDCLLIVTGLYVEFSNSLTVRVSTTLLLLLSKVKVVD